MDYTDIEAVESYILKDIDESFEPRVSAWITAMSRYADQKCNRVLCLTPTESEDMIETYTYDGDGMEVQIIKDCNSIEEVKIGDDVVEVFKYPSNKPYTSRIVLQDGSNWPRGRQNISVKAIQAMHRDLPADLKYAVTVLVGGICNNQIFGMQGTTERIGNYSITYDDTQKGDFEAAKSILKLYTRIAI